MSRAKQYWEKKKSEFRTGKRVKVMLDYCSTGIWNTKEHSNIPVEWLPASPEAIKMINSAQELYDGGQQIQAENMLPKIVAQLQKDLPDWDITYN